MNDIGGIRKLMKMIKVMKEQLELLLESLFYLRYKNDVMINGTEIYFMFRTLRVGKLKLIIIIATSFSVLLR